MKPSRTTPPPRKGVTLSAAFLVGMVLGLSVSGGVTWYILNRPNPFVNYAPHESVKLNPDTVKPAPAPAAKAIILEVASVPVAASGVGESKPRFGFYKILTDEPDGTAPAGVGAKTADKSATKEKETRFLQAGAFNDADDVYNFKDRPGLKTNVQAAPRNDMQVFRVQLGHFKNTEGKNSASAVLKQNGVPVNPLALIQQPESKPSEAPATREEKLPDSALTLTNVEEPAKVLQDSLIVPDDAPEYVPDTRTKPDKPIAKTIPEISTRTLVIAIDAGHGGEDPGAHGRGGTCEKNVTLAIARKLKGLVDDTQGMRGVLIRDGDYFIPLGGRVVKARKAHADLFISIHADAFIKPDARGSSVFALSEHGATSAAARWLAKNENEADLIGGVNIAVKAPFLARTLLDLSQTATITDSLKLGKHMLSELGSMNTLHRGFVEQAGFAVLKSPDIPSVLVETAFISNPSEERRLNDEDYQDKLAHAILGGIKRYFDQNRAISKQWLSQNE